MESVSQLLNEGLAITLIGMSVVFVLLTLLVGVVYGMSAFCRRVVGVETVEDHALASDELMAVIAVAIDHYRRGRA